MKKAKGYLKNKFYRFDENGHPFKSLLGSFLNFTATSRRHPAREESSPHSTEHLIQ